jgi:hypothetical protein
MAKLENELGNCTWVENGVDELSELDHVVFESVEDEHVTRSRRWQVELQLRDIMSHYLFFNQYFKLSFRIFGFTCSLHIHHDILHTILQLFL